jgi:hypothetical protein
MSATELTWFKSSYSGTQGDSCIEVAWFKSSHSTGDGDSCVEVAASLPRAVYVRDSKDRQGPRLALSPAAWSTFVARARLEA